MLKLNDDKTEVIIFGTKQNLSEMDDVSVRIGDSPVAPSSSVRNLGVCYDSNLKMDLHVSAVCRTSVMQLKNIGRIRKYLTHDATKTLINAMVTSRLDYANGLLYGANSSQIVHL